ncbi:hypothetical protein JXB27_00470 [Candidatus Woesearchaeota archaeon]|nr:hypothetical protein [Candidatus Woesearchaeota archaeon]
MCLDGEKMKTADGMFRLEDVVAFARTLSGVTIEEGTRHPYLLKYALAPVGNCALAGSTYVQAHLIPWFKKVTGLSKKEILRGLNQGYLEQNAA